MSPIIASEVEGGIHLSQQALANALELQRVTPDFNNLSLRLYLEGKGCDGFYYGVTFDAPQERDRHFSYGQLDVIVDPETLEFVQGSSIDWIDDERGRGFLVTNPRQKAFRGKFFKRSAWIKKLSGSEKLAD